MIIVIRKPATRASHGNVNEDNFDGAQRHRTDDIDARWRGRRCRLHRAVRIWYTVGRFWQGGGMCSQFRWSRVPH